MKILRRKIENRLSPQEDLILIEIYNKNKFLYKLKDKVTEW